MKNSILTILFALLSFGSFAQNGQGWVDLENMKAVMKQTFPLMMKNNDLSGAKQNAVELYEKAVLYNWNDIISDFRDKNQTLEQFCDFFERVMRKTHGITAETDQVTSN